MAITTAIKPKMIICRVDLFMKPDNCQFFREEQFGGKCVDIQRYIEKVYKCRLIKVKI